MFFVELTDFVVVYAVCRCLGLVDGFPTCAFVVGAVTWVWRVFFSGGGGSVFGADYRCFMNFGLVGFWRVDII